MEALIEESTAYPQDILPHLQRAGQEPGAQGRRHHQYHLPEMQAAALGEHADRLEMRRQIGYALITTLRRGYILTQSMYFIMQGLDSGGVTDFGK
jgi:hypothetical protein